MQQTRSTLPGLLLALVAVSAWGLSYIATEWLYTQGLGPFAVLTIRTFLAYAVLLILSHKQFLADELIDEAKFALLGVACIRSTTGLRIWRCRRRTRAPSRPSWPPRRSSRPS